MLFFTHIAHDDLEDEKCTLVLSCCPIFGIFHLTILMFHTLKKKKNTLEKKILNHKYSYWNEKYTLHTRKQVPLFFTFFVNKFLPTLVPFFFPTCFVFSGSMCFKSHSGIPTFRMKILKCLFDSYPIFNFRRL